MVRPGRRSRYSRADIVTARSVDNTALPVPLLVSVPLKVVRYRHSSSAKAIKVVQGCLYIPYSLSERGIDGFFVEDETMYLLQFTVGVRHGAKVPDWQGFVDYPDKSHSKHIFVLSHRDKFSADKTGYYSDDDPYTAEFPMRW